MFSFSPDNYRLNGNLYEFILPAQILGTANSVISFQQDNMNLNTFCNILRVLVKSATLSTNSDRNVGTNLLSSSDSITDFTVDIENGTLSDLAYSTDASIIPWRVYDLLNSSALRNIDVSIDVEYANGITRPLILAPGFQAIIRLSFFEKN
jgi:hypothetical protein